MINMKYPHICARAAHGLGYGLRVGHQDGYHAWEDIHLLIVEQMSIKNSLNIKEVFQWHHHLFLVEYLKREEQEPFNKKSYYLNKWHIQQFDMALQPNVPMNNF